MRRQKGKRRVERRIVELLLQRKSQREIIKRLGVGDRRVKKVKEQAEAFGYLSGAPLPPYPEAIFPQSEVILPRGFVSDPDEILRIHQAWIEERLRAGWLKITVHEELPAKVSRSSFYRFLERHGLDRIGEKRARRVVPEILHAAGECLQLDWGKLRDVVDPETGRRRTLWAFVGTLGHSRYLMVRLVWTNDVATTLTAIESMFQEMGGVPVRVTSDNPKCFALEASRYEPLLNPGFERFAGHYGVQIELLPPADPKKKGKVERMMPFIRRLYQAHGDAWQDLEESQAYLNRKLEIANQRRHGTTGLQPSAVFAASEKVALKPLPELAFEREEYHEGIVRKDGHVRFRGKYYSVDEEFIDTEVIVIGNKTQVFIYHEGRLLETHERIWNPHQSKSTKPHHLKPRERIMQDYGLYIKRAERIGPNFAELVREVLAQGQGFVDLRKVWGLLSLDKAHMPEAIDQAAKTALMMKTLSYRTVRSLLALSVKPDPKADAIATPSTNKFIRDLNEYKNAIQTERRLS